MYRDRRKVRSAKGSKDRSIFSVIVHALTRGERRSTRVYASNATSMAHVLTPRRPAHHWLTALVSMARVNVGKHATKEWGALAWKGSDISTTVCILECEQRTSVTAVYFTNIHGAVKTKERSTISRRIGRVIVAPRSACTLVELDDRNPSIF